MRRFSITVPTVAFSVVMNDATPVTSVTSDSVPISIVKLTRTVASICSWTACVTVRKPCSSALTTYGPGGNAGKLYAPESLLTDSRAAFVPVFVAVTVAPGMSAPDESFTSPVIVPRV